MSELPGMWHESDFMGGETDPSRPALEREALLTALDRQTQLANSLAARVEELERQLGERGV